MICPHTTCRYDRPSVQVRPTERPEPAARKRRAFIYDDDDCILNVLRYFFTQREYEVVTHQKAVVCPLDAETLVCSNPHACADVVITDFMMPGMNGVDLLLSQSRNGCKIPAKNKALMSGFADNEETKKIRDLGCSFFKKPFNLQELSRWLDEREQEMDL